ncbi:MAG: hypothetical protein PHE84_07785 [bacterium]|nr:hypothetical protein [bacterium]
MEKLQSVLELLYFASGPSLVILGIIGLWQLKIAKDTARLNARRQSLSLAAERCEYYIEHIIPLINIFDRAIKDHNINYFAKADITIENEKVRVKNNLTK